MWVRDMFARLPIGRRRTLLGLFVAAVLLTAVLGTQAHVSRGLPVPEWPLAVDLFVLVPLAYLVALRPPPRQALLGVAALLSFGVLFGSLVLPAQDQSLWRALEPLRWLFIAAVVVSQLGLMALVAIDIAKSPVRTNLESALHAALERRCGPGPVTGLLKVEGRMWLYALCRHARRFQFTDGQRFFVWKQGGNASNQAGFLVLLAAEIPVLHVLLHLASPMLAIGVTALSLYGWLFMLAELRASRLRPITVTDEAIRLRYGLVTDLTIPLSRVRKVEPCRGTPGRAKGRLRLAGMGRANVRIELLPRTRLPTTLGEREVSEVFVGVDEPDMFMRSAGADRSAGS